ncbi:MAG TPA: hypothetical protein VMC09_08995 [Anaerolineales bacterium]|nr:hypothetical protein [Anaerolineales bacterium]HVM72460.1 hypothetical protein [Anaerolineales bacterium]
MKRSGPALFWIQLKLVGWWPAAVSVLVLTTFYLLAARTMRHATAADLVYPRRAVETIAPLLFAVQAAFLLGPDNEPALELLLSYPKPLRRLVLERLILVAEMHLAVALTATFIFAATWQMESLGLALVRWLAAGIALAGVAVFTTQVTRQGIFGTLLATLLWAASLYGGDGILKAWRWFWLFHVYLQPEKYGPGIYLLNRLVLTGLGVGLFLLAMKFLGDEDRLLGVR